MTNVLRLREWAHTFMRADQMYDSIPYDYASTDAALLERFDKWKSANLGIKIISITGPLFTDIPSGGGSAGGKYAELIVLYEELVMQ